MDRSICDNASVSDIFRVFHERINADALIIAITRKTVPT